MTPTPQQWAIHGALSCTGRHLMVTARAGTGKTTTLVWLVNELLKARPRTRVLALAFNRHTATELGRRMPKAKCQTSHALAMGAVMAATAGAASLEDGKPARVAREVCPPMGREAGQALLGSSSLAMSTLTAVCDQDALQTLADSYGLELDQGGVALAQCGPLVTAMRIDRKKLTFDDMIDQTLIYNYRLPAYDIILVDEAQDLNAAQLALIERLVGTWGRLVAIGDPAQSIYRFRGAGSNSMAALAARFNPVELPLTVTFRCGKKIVEEARRIVPDYEAAPGNPDGEVRVAQAAYADGNMRRLGAQDMVLCRTNAPLIRPCLTMIKSGKPAYLLGRDLGGAMLRWMDRVGRDCALDTLLDRIAQDAERTASRLEERDPRAAADWRDRADTLIEMADGLTTVVALKNRIESLFCDTARGLPFATVHKAKGLEAEHVIIIRPDLMPPPWIAKAKDKALATRDEQNIKYVAITRAKSILTWQPIEKPKGGP